ncbi:hypothetical protein V1478_004474 [Vespula squamosa]|uniref:Uncharacterized protein n=1 Tax=Vespula squamosa TaxID=30214 RepID=A0ABD2BG95_VESSQ
MESDLLWANLNNFDWNHSAEQKRVTEISYTYNTAKSCKDKMTLFFSYIDLYIINQTTAFSPFIRVNQK